MDVARTEQYDCRADFHRRGDLARHSSQRLAAKGATECVRLRYNSAGLARAGGGPHSGGARVRVRALPSSAAPRAGSSACSRPDPPPIAKLNPTGIIPKGTPVDLG